MQFQQKIPRLRFLDLTSNLKAPNTYCLPRGIEGLVHKRSIYTLRCDLARIDITTAVFVSKVGGAPDKAGGLPGPWVQPELLPLPARTLPIEGIAGLGGRPPVLDQVRTAVAGQLVGLLVLNNHLVGRARSPRSHLDAGLTARRVYVVLEAAALRLMACHVVGKILSSTARPWRLLLEALSQRSPVVSVPVLTTMTP